MFRRNRDNDIVDEAWHKTGIFTMAYGQLDSTATINSDSPCFKHVSHEFLPS